MSAAASTRSYDVAVVGCGPVGVTAALLLARAGLSVGVIEREEEVYPLPRAGSIDHETLRVFQSLGVLDELADSIVPVSQYEFVTASGEVLIDASYPQGPTPAGSAAFMFMWQPDLERALRDRLLRQPAAALHLGESLTGLVNTGHGVELTSATVAGEVRRTHARYVLACDGGASPTRKLLGIPLDDFHCHERWLAIDARAVRPVKIPTAIQICDPARPTGVFDMPRDFCRWLFMVRPEESDEEIRDERYAELLAPWVQLDDIEILRRTIYTFHGLVARRWREGNTFLLGDAAHQTPPNLGQGLCSGIRDATNIAWKLRLVLRGQAAPGLLDTYETERDPHMRAIVEKSVELGRILCTIDPELAAERDRRLLAERASGAGDISRDRVLPGLKAGILAGDTPAAGSLFIQPEVQGDARLGLLDAFAGDGFVAVFARGAARRAGPLSERARRAWEILDGSAIAVTPEPAAAAGLALAAAGVRDVHGFLGEWFARSGCEVAIVRPDKYVFGTGASTDFGRLVEGLGDKLGLDLEASAANLA